MFHLLKRLPLMASAYLAYKRGKATVKHPPLHLWVDPTDVCNLRCTMCPTQRPGVRKKGFMTMELFQKVINEAEAGFPVVNLYMSGESLLHKEIFRMIDYAAEHRAATCLYTNATLLDEKKAGQLLDTQLDWLGFSFDGYDKESYENIRVRGDFEKTVANMERFLQLRKERGLRRPHTYLSLVELPELKAIPDSVKTAFKKRLTEAGIDQFEVSEPHNWAGQVNEFVQVEVPQGQNGSVPDGYTVCPAPWTMLAVLWDGEVVPCCLDTGAQYPLGNANEQTIMEIFNGERIQELRRALSSGEASRIDLCRNCSHLYDKQILGIPSKVWIEVRDNLKAALPKLLRG